MELSLTPAAAKQSLSIIEQEGLTPETGYLRVGVRGGGCSGFNYDLCIDDKEVGEMDEVFESHGVRVVTNSICLTYVGGTEIDYVEMMYGGGFKFNNPNAKSTCGCAQSFSVA